MKKPSKNAIEFLRKLDRAGVTSTSPSTGNIAKALVSRGLAKDVPIYSDGHHGDHKHLLYFKVGITNEGREYLRSLDFKITPAKTGPGLPEDVDYDEWLEEHGLAVIPGSSGVFYAVAYDHNYPNDPSEVIESCPAFKSYDDARIAAHELSRGNMPRVVLKCEVVARSEAHDD